MRARDSLRIVEVPSPAAAATHVVDRIMHIHEAHGHINLGVATGSSPLAVYRELERRCPPNLPETTTAFALDEYLGLPPSHPQLYRNVLLREFCKPIGVDPSRLHVPVAHSATDATAGARFEHIMADHGGVDLQLLGLGSNGHIAFNEPGSRGDSRTRVVELAPSTRADNARFFGSLAEVPTMCMTQGIGTILESKQIVLLAFGSAKADALALALSADPNANLPASFLQWHPEVTIYADAEALSKRHLDSEAVLEGMAR